MLRLKPIAVLLAVGMLAFASPAPAKKANKVYKPSEESVEKGTSVLWRNPQDIRSRNLFYGPGGVDHAPHTFYTFENEDRDGTSPKFTVRDENGVHWKVKLGPEARPETVASRLVWAVGYSANEDYFLPTLHVAEMPQHLHRGQKFVGPRGIANNVRLKRSLEDEKKEGPWSWRHNPFVHTRELSGLKVMMALINNWDLKDVNNSIYRKKHGPGEAHPEDVYMVSDLGASFGTTGYGWTQRISKGNLASYRHSKFVSKVTPEYVDFNVPTRASMIHIFDPPEYLMRLKLRWIGKHIPREDVRWIAQLLARLSPEQIRDAFRAAGYSPDEVDGFAKVVEGRIAELETL